ncbi:hypothetical protein QYE76_061234 [Lolium multiflorum]|uniref:BTB domain-containing protein n=1 Tax=Lolium multiflorum TaxID=4521 RepID=A0AAD8W6Z9_LOLMU|nr:hypothetical protein QYE76_061234 [Lolium multiflorum]
MAEHYKISAALVAEERSYMLKLDGYSRTKALVKTGECVSSAPFSVGGHRWAVIYYLNSIVCALYLVLDPAGAKDVKAKLTISVLDKNGEPVPSFSCTIPTHTFSRGVQHCVYSVSRADLEGSVHLRDDCLTVRCDVTVTEEICNEETKVPPSDLHCHLGDLLKNKDAADLTIQVGGQSFSAHRCVLAARSPVFKAELLGAMKENSGTPIEICDMEANVFKSLLHFIYTDKLPPVLESASNNGAGQLAMAGHLLVAADRYDIGRLKLICEEKLCNQIDSKMVATSLALAEQHGFHDLKEACLKFLAAPSNLEAMMASDGFEHLKSSCPTALKELIARILPPEQKAAKDLVMAI